MLNRAYAMLDVRSVSDGEDARTFEGWATTPTTDRMGDVVDPLGAKFKNPLPLLHQHDSSSGRRRTGSSSPPRSRRSPSPAR